MESQNYRHEAAAEYLGIAPPTLAKMRMRGDGPAYTRAGKRLIIYQKIDLDGWLAENRYRSTSEYVGGAK
jgi:hypothetical protein